MVRKRDLTDSPENENNYQLYNIPLRIYIKFKEVKIF